MKLSSQCMLALCGNISVKTAFCKIKKIQKVFKAFRIFLCAICHKHEYDYKYSVMFLPHCVEHLLLFGKL